MEPPFFDSEYDYQCKALGIQLVARNAPYKNDNALQPRQRIPYQPNDVNTMSIIGNVGQEVYSEL